MIVGATAVSATDTDSKRAVGVERRPTLPRRRRRSPSPGDTRGARTRCPSVPAASGQVDRHAQLIRLRRRCDRVPSTGRRWRRACDPVGRLQLDLGAQHQQRRAGVHRRRRVHHVAAERADVARRRRADQRAGIGERRCSRRRSSASTSRRACVTSAPMRTPSAEPRCAERLDAIDRDDASPGSGALPWRAPTTRSLPPATGRAPAATAASASSSVVAMVKFTS